MVRKKAVGALAVLVSVASSGFVAGGPLLLTRDQWEIDSLALSLRNEPVVIASRKEAIECWGRLRSASTKDGQRTLEHAVDEAVFATLRATAANDPARPRVIWTVAPPYQNGSQTVPGSRVGGDSPDRVYRAFAVDPKFTYEIRGRRSAQPSLEGFSFEAWPLPLTTGQPQAVLTSKDIDVDGDGRFVVTLDAQPSASKRNHLQLPPNTVTIFARDTLSEWSSQVPNELEVKRTDGLEGAPPDRAAIIRQAGEQIRATTQGVRKFIDWAWQAPANQITPFVREADWGAPGAGVAVNRFSIKSDEALVMTLDPVGEEYLSAQVTDPWLVSVDYWNHISSLSNRQATPNTDGTYTYVVSPSDPGVQNWLDTGGLNDGDIVVRWEGSSDLPPVRKAVKSARLVKLSELSKVLAPDTVHVTPDERRRQLDARAAQFRTRVALH